MTFHELKYELYFVICKSFEIVNLLFDNLAILPL